MRKKSKQLYQLNSPFSLEHTKFTTYLHRLSLVDLSRKPPATIVKKLVKDLCSFLNMWKGNNYWV